MEGEPLGLAGDRLAGQQRQDHLERFFHPRPQLGRLDAVHPGVGRQLAGADPEHRPALGQVVEQDDPLGDLEGVVVGQRDDAGAEPDLLGARRAVGQDQTPARR